MMSSPYYIPSWVPNAPRHGLDPEHSLKFNEWRRVYYPSKEHLVLNELDALMSEWSHAERAGHLFVSDGLFPYYLQQKVRVLFVLRESYRVEWDILTECTSHLWREGAIRRNLKATPHYKRILLMLYGIQNNFPDWKSLPKAETLAVNFGRAGGLSCALMHLRKDTRTGGRDTDWTALRQSVAISRPSDFIRREVSLLAPDVILASGIPSYLHLLADSVATKPTAVIDGNIRVYPCKINGKRRYIFSIWHLPTPSRSASRCFYYPLKTAMQKYGLI